MKQRIGIVGYGNLGRAAEEIALKSEDIELVAIFSRREGVASKYGTKVELYSNAKDYVDKIDVMLMCGGSKKDLEVQSLEMLEYFNIVDTFDTHARITEHRKNLEVVSKKTGKTAIYSCGWDPGLFSIIRVLASSLLEKPKVYTFWGKGVSQGHSDALRRVEGVEDAIQYTIPCQEEVSKVRTDYNYIPKQEDMHIRECFVSIKDGYDKESIEKEIMNIDNYFKGQKVKIHFVKKELVEKLRKRMYHAGQIIGTGEDKKSQMRFYVKMKSNPNFTANIALCYLKAIKNLPTGVYSVLDIAPKYLMENCERYL